MSSGKILDETVGQTRTETDFLAPTTDDSSSTTGQEMASSDGLLKYSSIGIFSSLGGINSIVLGEAARSWGFLP